VNANLDQSGIDTSRADELVTRGKTQILTAQNLSRNGDPAGVRASLSELRDTLKALRDNYRDILINEELPQTTAHGVLSVAQSLDVTAAQMGTL
jgi:hypothetical protein